MKIFFLIMGAAQLCRRAAVGPPISMGGVLKLAAACDAHPSPPRQSLT